MANYTITHDRKNDTITLDVTVDEHPLTTADIELIRDITSKTATVPAFAFGAQKPTLAYRKQIAREALADMLRRTDKPCFYFPGKQRDGQTLEDIVLAESRELARLDMSEISYAAFKFAGADPLFKKIKTDGQAMDILHHMKAGLKVYPGVPTIMDVHEAWKWKPSDF